MVALGSTALRLMPDGWTIETADGRPAAHFEHTVAITDDGVSVLTAGRNGFGWAAPS
jgi:methionyl aminopeptidase